MDIARALLGSSDQLNEKMVALKRKLQLLESKEDDVKEELKQVEFSFLAKKPRKEVQNWLAEVERIKTQVQEEEQEVQERRSWHRNPQLHKNVDKLTTEVMELTEQSKFPRGLTLEAYEREGVPFPTKRLIGETFQKNKRMIWDCLTGNEDLIIGIYGMGGVGKTTLLTHIHNELLKHCINVSWVNVSQNFSIHKLQDDIAKTLHLDISNEDDQRKRAARLASALNHRNKFILILDDVWEAISPDEVGIRIGINPSKLVMTTRSLAVCRQMSCQKKIIIEPLSHQEAWILFMETMGNDTSLSPQIKEVANALVKECDGLPLGVVTMAGSMKGVEDTQEWRYALEEIRGAKHMDMDRVLVVLEYSYRKLNASPKLQECFLYCSLFPEDTWIQRDELIQLFIDEKLINGMKSRKSQFEEGHVMLNRLENVCLLEGSTDEFGFKAVKMHDLVRDMAIRVTSVGPCQFLVKAGMKLSDIPNEEEWSQDLVRVSLRSNNIKSIPFYSSPPKCPKLLTLFLCMNKYLKVIPRLFFVHMKSLTLLDLSYTSIKSLPSSISNLESLTSLSLRGCHKLRSVAYLETLGALRRLDLSRTTIKQVPENLEKLIDLRNLNLNNCWNLKMIPVGILSKLSHMEFFESARIAALNGEEIGSWKKLEEFYGRFDNISDFNSCIRSWEKRTPEKYNVHVGMNYNDDDGDGSYNRRIVILHKLVAGTENRFLLPRGIWVLRFDHCHGMASLSHSIATPEEAPDLWKCQVYWCDSIRHVICSCCCSVLFFQSLESLDLWRLPMLINLVGRERIPPPASSSVLPTNTFSSLRKLKISECDGLKSLFTLTLFSHLQSLESCEVLNCRQLAEIIETSDEDVNEEATTEIISMPPRFNYLLLWYLPELKSLCNSSIKLSDSLEKIRIRGCQGLKRITLLWEGPHPHPSFHTCVEKSWWNSVEWKHPKTKDILQPYVKFI